MSIRGTASVRKQVAWLLRRAEGALLPAAVLEREGSHLDPGGARARLGELAREHPSLALGARMAALDEASERPEARAHYVGRFGCAGVRRFDAAGGTQIYQLTVETFPRHVNNLYLVIDPGHALLFDVGSGSEISRRDLALGFAVARAAFGIEARYEDLDAAVVSHAHIDHFGGALDLRAGSRATLAVHELDYRVLAAFEERVVLASRDVERFLRGAGVEPLEVEELLEMYAGGRSWFRSVEVHRALRDGDVVGPGHRVVHTPGHCPGQICLLVGDVLLTSDHVLARITPHQFPQAITPFGGLDLYFGSLEKARRVPGVRLALGGHEDPIEDLDARVGEIIAFHEARLGRVLEACAEPRNLVEVSAALFGAQAGYGRILAVEEAGAHVEHLHARGALRVANLDELSRSRDPVLRYVRR